MPYVLPENSLGDIAVYSLFTNNTVSNITVRAYPHIARNNVSVYWFDAKYPDFRVSDIVKSHRMDTLCVSALRNLRNSNKSADIYWNDVLTLYRIFIYRCNIAQFARNAIYFFFHIVYFHWDITMSWSLLNQY